MKRRGRGNMGPPAELTEERRRACFFAERLMLVESRIAGDESNFTAPYTTALGRAAGVGFTTQNLARFRIFRGTLELSTLSEVQQLRGQYRVELARTLGCEPTEIEATPDRVWQRAKIRSRRQSVGL